MLHATALMAIICWYVNISLISDTNRLMETRVPFAPNYVCTYVRICNCRHKHTLFKISYRPDRCWHTLIYFSQTLYSCCHIIVALWSATTRLRSCASVIDCCLKKCYRSNNKSHFCDIFGQFIGLSMGI